MNHVRALGQSRDLYTALCCALFRRKRKGRRIVDVGSALAGRWQGVGSRWIKYPVFFQSCASTSCASCGGIMAEYLASIFGTEKDK